MCAPTTCKDLLEGEICMADLQNPVCCPKLVDSVKMKLYHSNLRCHEVSPEAHMLHATRQVLWEEGW